MDKVTASLEKYYEALNRRQTRRLSRALTGNPEADIVEAAELMAMDEPAKYAAWRKEEGGNLRGTSVRKNMGGDVEMASGEKRYIDPTATDVHVDGLLTAMSVQYRNDSYIADQVAPVVQVNKQSDTFFTYGQSDFLRDEAEVRAAGGPTAQAGYTLSRSPYSTVERAIETIVPHTIRDNSDNPLSADRDAVDFATEKMMISRERRIATLMGSISNVGSGRALASLGPWTSALSGTPIDDVRSAQAFIKRLTGKTPNTLIVSWPVLQGLQDHPDITDRVKHSERADQMALFSAIPRILGIERMLIGDAVYETQANRGGTSSLSFIWEGAAIVAYIEPTPRLRSVTGALSFAFQRRTIRRGVDTRNKFDWVQAEDNMDEQIIARNCIYTFTGAAG